MFFCRVYVLFSYCVSWMLRSPWEYSTLNTSSNTTQAPPSQPLHSPSMTQNSMLGCTTWEFYKILYSIPHCVSCASQGDAVIILCFTSFLFLFSVKLKHTCALLLCGLLNCTYIFRGTLDFKKVRNSYFVCLTLIVKMYFFVCCSFFCWC